MSGLIELSNRVGPRPLKSATKSSPRCNVPFVFTAPTVIADWAFPGEVTVPYFGVWSAFLFARLPAATTTTTPSLLSASTACTSGSVAAAS